MKPAAFAALLVVLVPVAALAQTAPAKAGEVSALLPVGRIQRGASAAAEAKLNDELRWQDWFETAAKGRARLALVDGSQVNVGSDARLQVVRSTGATQQTEVELQFGKIRSQVTQRPAGEKFEVRTNSAVIGVIGTHFYVSFVGALSTVINFGGEVTVRNADPAVAGEEKLAPFELAEIEPGKPPRKRWATLEEILRAMEDTLPGPVLQFEPQRAHAGSCVAAKMMGSHLGAAGVPGPPSPPAEIPSSLAFPESLSTARDLVITSRRCEGPDIRPVRICVPEDAQPGAYEYSFASSDGTTHWAAFLIEPPAELQDAWLVYLDPLPLGATHTARLLGAEEKPLAGVRVHIRQGGAEKTVTTDDEGGFVIEARQLGALEVEVPRGGRVMPLKWSIQPFDANALKPIKVMINVVKKVEDVPGVPEFAQRGSLVTVKGELESVTLGDRKLPLLKTVLRGGGALSTFPVPRQIPEGTRPLSLTEPGRPPREQRLFVYDIVGGRLDQHALISGNVTPGEFLVCVGVSDAQPRKLRARISAVGPVQFRGKGAAGKRFEDTLSVTSSGLLRIPFQIQAEKTGTSAAIPFTLTLVLSEH
ncbi:MAG TPA: FecR family protein [Candidatus Acidoferrales bacterium]|nr:FecR family protein [Candidatus Acidoferrales bacterium]